MATIKSTSNSEIRTLAHASHTTTTMHCDAASTKKVVVDLVEAVAAAEQSRASQHMTVERFVRTFLRKDLNELIFDRIGQRAYELMEGSRFKRYIY
jgi:hypothetical protein